MANLITRILTMGEGKQFREYDVIVEQVNSFEPAISPLTDDELRAKTVEFRARLADGETLDDLLPEAFAVVREASIRTLGMRHFDVQIIGGIVLHRGNIAEMKTGEGKTLVATLPVYLNALAGNGVHVVTVNDYLAKRDSEWMGRVYRFLGLEVGIIQSGMDPKSRKPAYAADVTYGTNSEFGFDYLRDNMVTRPELRVQRGHHYAIVDEVDSILIDEARTPLIISGAAHDDAPKYRDADRVARKMVELNRILRHAPVDEFCRITVCEAVFLLMPCRCTDLLLVACLLFRATIILSDIIDKLFCLPRFLSIKQHFYFAFLGTDHYRLFPHAPHHIKRVTGFAPQGHLQHVLLHPLFESLLQFMGNLKEPVCRTQPPDPLMRPLVVIVGYPQPDPFPGFFKA